MVTVDTVRVGATTLKLPLFNAADADPSNKTRFLLRIRRSLLWVGLHSATYLTGHFETLRRSINRGYVLYRGTRPETHRATGFLRQTSYLQAGGYGETLSV
jgi:hypothetical protein